MTNIDWKKIVKEYEEDFFKDLFTLLEIDSTRDDSKASEKYPVGPGPAKALHAFLDIGKRDGFSTENFDNWAGHLEYGSEGELLGILGHVDVVPAGTGWDTDPFKPVIKDGRVYARGSSDDKGPTMAAYYALKIIRDLDLPISKRIRVIIGTDEESEWKCMDHYLEVAETPDFGFSPDADFPIINGEKGNVSVQMEFEGDNSGDFKLQSFNAGLRLNMVPESATAIVDTEESQDIIKDFETFLNEHKVTGQADLDNGRITFKLNGKSAHGSTPEQGINGATYLAKFLNNYSFEKDAKTFLNIAATFLFENHYGKKLGIDHEDPLMGSVSSNFGIFEFEAGKSGKIVANMRYPQGTNDETILGQFKSALADEKVDCSLTGIGKPPHYVPKDDPLVQTLLDVYARQTGLEADEKIIGGGTYGRLLERGVAYGAMFPDSIDTMHQANEFMAVDDLMNAMAIYAEAIYELVK